MSEDGWEDSSVDLSLLSEGGSGDEGEGAQTQPVLGPSSAHANKGQGHTAHIGTDASPKAKKRKRPLLQAADGQHGTAQPGSTGEPEEMVAEDKEERQRRRKERKKVLSEAKLRRLKEAAERRGVVYVSRIPPHMKPAKLKQLLSQHGSIGRVYCTPEDPTARRLRKKKGGNTGKNFTEGWVEFEDKRIAKQVAKFLNGQPIGGSKRSAYHYDLWNLKYLPKFKWDHLTEEVAYEKAVREQRLAAELAAAKRERDFYLSRVDRAKAEAAMAERRAAKALAGGDENDGAHGGPVKGSNSAPKAVVPRRHYGQRKAKADPVLDENAAALADDVIAMVAG